MSRETAGSYPRLAAAGWWSGESASKRCLEILLLATAGEWHSLVNNGKASVIERLVGYVVDHGLHKDDLLRPKLLETL